MWHSRKPVFTLEKRVKLKELLAVHGKGQLHIISGKLGVSYSSLDRELKRRGGLNNYDPYLQPFEVIEIENITKFSPEKNEKVYQLIQDILQASKRRSYRTSHKFNTELRLLVRQYIELDEPFTRENLALYMRVSELSLQREVKKNGGWDNYKPVEIFRFDNRKDLVKELYEENKVLSLQEQVEALKMHINILYEQIEQLRDVNE